MNHKKFFGTANAALMIVIILTLVLAPGAWAQSKFKTLYKFTGGTDGSQPRAGLIFDQAGNMYGMTQGGGANGFGTVFKLTPNSDGSWSETVLHRFTGDTDGFMPHAGLTFDVAGNLYGTTSAGGAYGSGTVFELTPSSDGSWTENVLHHFNGKDGRDPMAGLIFDAAGNLYSTTFAGGAPELCVPSGGCGTVFKLTPNSDGSWTESVLYSFCSIAHCTDGGTSQAGLTFDAAGNLYGTTPLYGSRIAFGYGVVFKLTPNSDGSWTEAVLHQFRGGKDGGHPYANVTFDAAGNLYGTTNAGGAYGGGTVFELTPNSDGSWTENVLHHFNGKDGRGPMAGLIFDQAGNLYGTTEGGGNPSCGSYSNGCGVVFRLTPNAKGRWNETVLHTFTDHPGAFPLAGLVFDAAGNLYGTTSGDGTTTFGSVFEITP